MLIMIRKHLLKDRKGPAKISSQTTEDCQRLETQNSMLQTEKDVLEERMKELEVRNKSSSDIVELLEEKIVKIEAAALKTFEEKN